MKPDSTPGGAAAFQDTSGSAEQSNDPYMWRDCVVHSWLLSQRSQTEGVDVLVYLSAFAFAGSTPSIATGIRE